MNQWHTAVWYLRLRYETKIQLTYLSHALRQLRCRWVDFIFVFLHHFYLCSFFKELQKRKKGPENLIIDHYYFALLTEKFRSFFCPEKEWKLGQHYLCFATIFLDSFIEIRSDGIIVRCNGSLPFEQVSLVKSFIGLSSITALSHSM